MSWFTNLRILAYCRRFVRAQESIAQSLRTIAQVIQDDWESKHKPRPSVPADIHFFDPQRASDDWERRQREGL